MSGIKITIVTLASAEPELQSKDLEFARVIRQGLERLGVDANIELIDFARAGESKDHRFVAALFPVYRTEGIGISPAFFLNEEIISYGRVPTVDEFVKVIEDRFEFEDLED